jgi:transposase
VTSQLLSVVAPKIRGREMATMITKLAARARRTGRLILVVLDNAQLHRSTQAKAAWARHGAWVRPFWLPAYCPDLNDIERIWKREKEHYFANNLAPTFKAFESKVRRRFRTLAHTKCRRERRRGRLCAPLSRMIKDFLGAA